MRSEQSDEDIHLSAELQAPLAALTERSFDETPIEKIEAARNEGPFALYRLCFHWSSDVVNDGKAVRELLRVQRGLPPLRWNSPTPQIPVTGRCSGRPLVRRRAGSSFAAARWKSPAAIDPGCHFCRIRWILKREEET